MLMTATKHRRDPARLWLAAGVLVASTSPLPARRSGSPGSRAGSADRSRGRAGAGLRDRVLGRGRGRERVPDRAHAAGRGPARRPGGARGAVVAGPLPRLAAEVNYTGELTFADSGFLLGERYRWRVRAVVNGTAGDLSEPVDGETQTPTGPEQFLTGFELSNGASWTLHEDEVEVVEGDRRGKRPCAPRNHRRDPRGPADAPRDPGLPEAPGARADRRFPRGVHHVLDPRWRAIGT